MGQHVVQPDRRHVVTQRLERQAVVAGRQSELVDRDALVLLGHHVPVGSPTCPAPPCHHPRCAYRSTVHRALRSSRPAAEVKNVPFRGCIRGPMGDPPGSAAAVTRRAAASRGGCPSRAVRKGKGAVPTPLHFQRIAHRGAMRQDRVVPAIAGRGQQLRTCGTREVRVLLSTYGGRRGRRTAGKALAVRLRKLGRGTVRAYGTAREPTRTSDRRGRHDPHRRGDGPRSYCSTRSTRERRQRSA